MVVEKSKFSENIAFDKDGNRYISAKVVSSMTKDIFDREEKIEKLEKENEKLKKENKILDNTAKERDRMLARLDACDLNYYSTDFEAIGKKLCGN